jgi:hypothetical protein
MEAAMKFEFVDQSQDRKTDRPDDSTNRAGAADKVIRLGVNGSGKGDKQFCILQETKASHVASRQNPLHRADVCEVTQQAAGRKCLIDGWNRR